MTDISKETQEYFQIYCVAKMQFEVGIHKTQPSYPLVTDNSILGRRKLRLQKFILNGCHTGKINGSKRN